MSGTKEVIQLKNPQIILSQQDILFFLMFPPAALPSLLMFEFVIFRGSSTKTFGYIYQKCAVDRK